MSSLRASSAGSRVRRALPAIVIADLIATVLLRRRGYRFGGWVVVRCREGHLFTTIWVPLVSVKSLRLGWWRLQWCPVGRHWSLVHPVRVSQLSQVDQRDAAAVRDLPIP